jgi:hypothetical protein
MEADLEVSQERLLVERSALKPEGEGYVVHLGRTLLQSFFLLLAGWVGT